VKGGMVVVGERSRATKERVTRVLGIGVGRSSSEDFMTNGHRRRWRVRKSMEIDGEFVNRPKSKENDEEFVNRHLVGDAAQNKFEARVPGTCVPIRGHLNRVEVRRECVDRSNLMESS
jgi:hypothetical protein